MRTGLTVAFDADDTLWHNENAFADVEQLFNELVSPWADAETAERVLIAQERSRVATYGYGVKSFALSMIAAACDLSDHEIDARTLRRFVEAADDLLAMPTVAIDGAVEALEAVSAEHPTLIITKGDLHHQLRRHRIDPARFVMIGNSIVSDVAPLVEIGARAIHVPYETTWALETAAEDPPNPDRWTRVDSIREVPGLIETIAADLDNPI